MTSHAGIAGAAMTRFGKETRTCWAWRERAVADALADAGIEPGEVQQAFFGNTAAGLLHGQEMISNPPTAALRPM